MSYDVVAVDLPAEFKSFDDVPSDWEWTPSRPRAQLIEQIQSAAPGMENLETGWGTLDGDGWSIELNVGEDELCNNFMLHIRGGDEVMLTVAAILRATGFRPINEELEGLVEDPTGGLEGIRQWRAYMTQVREHIATGA